MSGVLQGLHAAHEAKTESGEPLGIVHRDVSPQNIVVGIDGVARVLDFGVAKAKGRSQTTHDGQVKGKFGYMAPEQMKGEAVTRQSDVYAAGVVLWEMLTGKRLFDGENDAHVMQRVLYEEVPRPSTVVPEIPEGLQQLVLQALSRKPARRFATALAFAEALEREVVPATSRALGAWVEEWAALELEERSAVIAEIESGRWTGAAAEEMPTVADHVAAQKGSVSGVVAPSSRRGPSKGAIAAGLLAITSVVAIILVQSRASPPSPGSIASGTRASAIVQATPPAAPTASSATPSREVEVALAPSLPPAGSASSASPGNASRAPRGTNSGAHVRGAPSHPAKGTSIYSQD
jgi:serine/threonine-protein kinase